MKILKTRLENRKIYLVINAFIILWLKEDNFAEWKKSLNKKQVDKIREL